MKTLRLILGDQLNYRHTWYRKTDDNVVYLLMEMRQETDYTLHHAQKVIGFFAAMFNFARYLEKKGHCVVHLQINDKENTSSLAGNLDHFISRHKMEKFEYQLPDEWRLDEQLKSYCSRLKIKWQVYDTEHFLSTRNELSDLFEGKKNYLMETFYRHMRKKHGVLMEGIQPEGGKWNYDSENRKSLAKGQKMVPPLEFNHNYSDIWNEIKKAGVKTFGDHRSENFPYPTTRKQGLQVLDHFLKNLFALFGTYQDAMTVKHQTLFHSRISFALNTKMISPAEVVNSAVMHYRHHSKTITLEQCEGFVRQIIGWREYMRGVYWAHMPGYAQLNYFNHTAKLPSWFWTGDTKMNCLHHAITQSLQTAYAHHIQRLMITGNFALLAGLHPEEVDQWYLGIYIDAIEWVEITNTRGMSQFADGGVVGTKPYVSSANYIHKMSDYCKGCHYNKSERIGEKACPFNSLYWWFFEQHRNKLEGNIRMSMMYNLLNKMEKDERNRLFQQAQYYLENIEKL